MIEFPASAVVEDWTSDDWTPPGWSDEQVTAESRAAAAWFNKTGGGGR